MPCLQRRRERAAGDLADPRRPRRSTAMCGRGMPRSERQQPPQQPAPGPAARSASSASRPQNAGFSQPTAQPEPGLHRGDLERQVLAVQRVAHLGPQRVARAEPARQPAERRPRRDQRVPERGRRRPTAAAARSRARRCSRCGRPRPSRRPRRRRRTTCSRGSVGRPSASSTSAERGPCTASTPNVSVLVADLDAVRRRGREPPHHLGGVRGVRHQEHVVVGDAGRRSGRRRRRRTSSQHSVYCACPGPIRPRSLVRQR